MAKFNVEGNLVSPIVIKSMTLPPAMIIKNNVEKTMIANGLSVSSETDLIVLVGSLHRVIILLTFYPCVS